MATAAQRYGLPRSTLRSRLDLLRKKYSSEELNRMFGEDSGNESDKATTAASVLQPLAAKKFSNKYSTKQVLSEEHERQIVMYLKKKICDLLNHGLSAKEVRLLAEISKCKVHEQWHTKKEARKYWLRGFLKRHLDISFRVAEKCSIARAASLNRSAVKEFFENYTLASWLTTTLNQEIFTIWTKQAYKLFLNRKIK